MRILVYGLNYSPELTGIGKYTSEFARYMSEAGHAVTVIASQPYYPEWRVHQGYSRWKYKTEVEGSNISVFRCPLYVPSRVTTLKRILHLMSFAISSLPILIRAAFHRPQIIWLVAPTLMCAPAALLFAKAVRAISILHIQDYEIDAVKNLRLLRLGALERCLAWIERHVLRRFDRVSTISGRMLERAIEKGVDREKVSLIPNWVDTSAITPRGDGKALRRMLSIDESEKVILYSGNLGQKQGLEVIPELALAFTHRPEVRFVIVGEGAVKDSLMEKCREVGVSRVVFHPLLPEESFPDLLSMADIHLVLQRGSAADTVMPSKLTNILAAGGHAVVTASDGTELSDLASKHPGVISVAEPDDTGKLIEALESMLLVDTTKVNIAARHYAIRALDSRLVLGRVEGELRNIRRVAAPA